MLLPTFVCRCWSTDPGDGRGVELLVVEKRLAIDCKYDVEGATEDDDAGEVADAIVEELDGEELVVDELDLKLDCDVEVAVENKSWR